MQSYTIYYAPGGNRLFSVPFRYLDKSHVFASVNGQPVGIVGWPTPFVADIGVSPAPGAVVKIYRKTPTNPNPIEFADGSIWKAGDFNDLADFAALLAEEAADSADGSMRLTDSDTYTAHDKQVTDLAPGVARTDAATKGQLDDMKQAALDAASAATTAAAQAHEASEGATIAAGQAEAAANNATQALSNMAASLPLKIAVLGDSLSAQQDLLGESWPTVLERVANSQGASVSVTNFSVAGHSFYRASTTKNFNGNTALQAVIASNPAVVLIALGFNDTVNAVDGRSLAQAKADAVAVLSALKSALPNAKLVYVAERAFDAFHISTVTGASTLYNRHVLPGLWTTETAGFWSGIRYQALGNSPTSATTKLAFADWCALDADLRGNSSVSLTITMDVWRMARLGGCGSDGVHPSRFGSLFLASYVMRGLRESSALRPLLPLLMSTGAFDAWSDPDTLFSARLTSDGSAWVSVYASSEAQFVQAQGRQVRYTPDQWFLPNGWVFSISSVNLTTDATQAFMWSIANAPAGAQVMVSPDGVSWNPMGTTNANGWFFQSGSAEGFPLGSLSLYYRVGNSAWGPVTVTVTDTDRNPVRQDLANASGLSSGALSTSDMLPIKRQGVLGAFKTTVLDIYDKMRTLTHYWTAAQAFQGGAALGPVGVTLNSKTFIVNTPAAGGYVQVAHGLALSKVQGMIACVYDPSFNNSTGTVINSNYYLPPYTSYAFNAGMDATLLTVRVADGASQISGPGSKTKVTVFYTP